MILSGVFLLKTLVLFYLAGIPEKNFNDDLTGSIVKGFFSGFFIRNICRN